MSEVSNKLLQRATYLRNLMIAHATGRQVNESDYHKLRHYFMGMAATSDRVPSLVLEHVDLSSLWQSLKYSCGSVEERKLLIMDTFEDFLDHLSASVSEAGEPNAVKKQLEPLDELSLNAHWQEAAALAPEAATEAMKALVERLCFQLLKELKVVPDPMQNSLKQLVLLTQRSLMLAPGKRYSQTVKELLKGCEETLNAIENFRADRAHHKEEGDKQIGSNRVLISLYGSLCTMLMAAWRVNELIAEGETLS
jgi:hypothetical protein